MNEGHTIDSSVCGHCARWAHSTRVDGCDCYRYQCARWQTIDCVVERGGVWIVGGHSIYLHYTNNMS